jgi:serine/threonine protein kinase
MDSLTATDLRHVGEFRLLARLGAGGMGQVFLGSSLAGRIVAVKVTHRELGQDIEFVRRFRNEVEAAQKVSGWYTAPVVAAGSTTTRPGWRPPSSPARPWTTSWPATGRCPCPPCGGSPPG